MKFHNALLSLGICALSASARPHALPEATPAVGQMISLEMVKKAAEEYGHPLEGLQKRAGTVVASATAAPTDVNADKYTIPMRVGNQIFNVVLDTGSQNFWVLGSKIPSNSVGPSQTIYTPGATATSVVGMSYTAAFDGGVTAAAGDAYIDNVAIGSATATQMTFGVATSVAAPGTGIKSGIIGLSFSSKQYNYKQNGQNVNPPTYMNGVLNTLANRLFTLDLRSDATGTLDLGFINTAKITNPISYANRVFTNYVNWYIAPGSYFVNGAQGSAGTVDFYHPDSGAPFMSFPQAIVDDYYSQVQNWTMFGGVHSFPCAHVMNNKIPSFGVTVGGTTFTVPADYMWSAQSADKKMCRGSLQPNGLTLSGAGKTGAILGDMFLRTVHAVYDYDGNGGLGRVGFAPKTLPARPPPV